MQSMLTEVAILVGVLAWKVTPRVGLCVEFMYGTLVLRVLNTDTDLYYCTTVAL